MQYIEILKKAILLMRRLAALTLAAFMTFLSVLTLGIDALSAGKRHPEVSKVNVLLIDMRKLGFFEPMITLSLESI